MAGNKVTKRRQESYFLAVYWLNEGAEQEVKIILPELLFEKQHDRDT